MQRKSRLNAAKAINGVTDGGITIEMPDPIHQEKIIAWIEARGSSIGRAAGRKSLDFAKNGISKIRFVLSIFSEAVVDSKYDHLSLS